MKQFSCGDVVPGCTAQWQRTSDDEIVSAVAEHARAEHELASLSDELERAVRDATTTV